MKSLWRWLFGPSCRVYIAARMTGRDKSEMVKRAQFVNEVLIMHGIDPISPILEEHVKPEAGKLVNHDKDRLRGFWKRDKQIIRYEAHVVLLDHAEMKSFGMEREYCLSRGVLWKPTCILVSQGTPLSVSQFEDDYIAYSVHAAAAHIAREWGCRWDRWQWRVKMLVRSFPRFVYDQLYQWR